MNTMCQLIRVLIVDDHSIMRQGLSQLLQSDDSVEVVAEAADGREGLRLAAELEPDVVLVDYQMPGMNGAEVAAELRIQFPELAVIGLSNDDRPQVQKNMLDAGANDFLLKGATLEQLLESINTAVSR